MRYDENARFIYYPNPKCASTSIRDFFDKHFEQFAFTNMDEHTPIRNINKAFLKNCDVQSKEIFQKSFSFTTVRNPWKRLVSLFLYSKTNTDGLPYWEPDYNPHKELMSFETWFDTVWLPYYENDVTTVLPIEKYAYDSDGKCIVTKIYPVETFSLDNMLCDYKNHTGIDFKDTNHQVLEKINQTSKNYDYRAYFDATRKETVASLFKNDIRIGNYNF